jgi:hypothetical protein
MNQLGLYYIYTWEYHKKTPCVAPLSQTSKNVNKKIQKKGISEYRWLVSEEFRYMAEKTGIYLCLVYGGS